MGIIFHKNLTSTDAHSIVWREVVDSAALAALVLVAADNGKVVKQLDTGAYYVLTDYSVPTWTALAAGVAAGVDSFNGRTGPVVPVEGDYGLDLLSDVNLTVGPADTQVLVYDSGTSTWIAGNQTGTGSTTLDALTDTDLAGKADTNVLAYNSTSGKWEPVAAGTGSGTVTSVAISGTDGLQVDSGSPITTSGTIALGVDAVALRIYINVENNAVAAGTSGDAFAGSHAGGNQHIDWSAPGAGTIHTDNYIEGTLDTSGIPVALDFARFTDVDTVEGRSYAEARADLSLEVGTDVQAYDVVLDATTASFTTAIQTDIDSKVDTFGTPVALDFARFTDVDTVEGRSYSEVRTDLGLVIGTNVQAYDVVLDATTASFTTAIQTDIDSKVDTFGTPVALDFARFTDADTVEGRSYTEVRTDLGLVIGTNVQAYSAVLDATTASFTTAKDTNVTNNTGKLVNVTTISPFIGTVLDDTTAAAALTTLGLGPKYNLAIDPGPNDDSANTSTNGVFGIGSRWYNTTSREWFECTDATPTLAAWQPYSSLGSLGKGDVGELNDALLDAAIGGKLDGDIPRWDNAVVFAGLTNLAAPVSADLVLVMSGGVPYYTTKALLTGQSIAQGLHSARPAATAGTDGDLWLSTNNTQLFRNNSTTAWDHIGMHQGTNATRTGLSLGTADAGYVFLVTDASPLELWQWNGTAWTQVGGGGGGAASPDFRQYFSYTAAGGSWPYYAPFPTAGVWETPNSIPPGLQQLGVEVPTGYTKLDLTFWIKKDTSSAAFESWDIRGYTRAAQVDATAPASPSVLFVAQNVNNGSVQDSWKTFTVAQQTVVAGEYVYIGIDNDISVEGSALTNGHIDWVWTA